MVLENGSELQRCTWLTKDPLYIQYHDEEWGVPQYDSLKLFEMICLEGQQAGLSWITVLKKRKRYREVFFNFDPSNIATMNESDVEVLSNDIGIIRHKPKILSVIDNAKSYLKMERSGEDFSQFIWNFVDDKQIVNNWTNGTDIPNTTDISEALSIALKKRGFKFVGPTICYAFMQACGLVDDHILSCYKRLKKLNA